MTTQYQIIQNFTRSPPTKFYEIKTIWACTCSEGLVVLAIILINATSNPDRFGQTVYDTQTLPYKVNRQYVQILNIIDISAPPSKNAVCGFQIPCKLLSFT